MMVKTFDQSKSIERLSTCYYNGRDTVILTPIDLADHDLANKSHPICMAVDAVHQALLLAQLKYIAVAEEETNLQPFSAMCNL